MGSADTGELAPMTDAAADFDVVIAGAGLVGLSLAPGARCAPASRSRWSIVRR